MSATATGSLPRIPRLWTSAALASVVLAAVALLVHADFRYDWALTTAVAGSAGYIAAVDLRTLLLPNKYTVPLAGALTVQVIAVAMAENDPSVLTVAAVAGSIVFATYVLFGLAGWVGFGDAKFAGGLALAAAITGGLDGLLIPLLAVLLSGAWRLIRRAKRGQAHGPAIAVAAVLVIICGAIESVR